MSRSTVALLLVVVFLVACGGTQGPAPTVALAVPSLRSRAGPATGPAPAPTGTTTLPQATPALPTPPEPTTILLPVAVQTPLPAYLRTLEFGIPAGNSYYPQAMAVDAGLGRLYARTRGMGRSASGMVTVMDSETGEVIRTVETGADEYGDGDLAVDAVRSRLYVANGGLYIVNQGIYLADVGSLSVTGVLSDTLPQNPGYSPNPTAVDAGVDHTSFCRLTHSVPWDGLTARVQSRC